MMKDTGKNTEAPATTAVDSLGVEKSLGHRLSVTSKMYDRDNKGYLDSTEIALRQMDTENTGEFSNEKMFKIMSDLKSEQKKTTIAKRVVTALSVVGGLLVLAVVATSLATVKLAQDVSKKESSSDVTVYSVKVDTTENGASTGMPDDTFAIDIGTADALMESVCIGWPGITQYEATDTFSCRLSGSAMLEHCDNEYMTSLKYDKKPTLSSDHGVVTFHYHGERGGHNVGKVAITCDMMDTNSGTACVVSGLTCATLCDTCTDTGGRLYWWCGQDQACGCEPHSDTSCLDVSDQVAAPVCDETECVVTASWFGYQQGMQGGCRFCREDTTDVWP